MRRRQPVEREAHRALLLGCQPHGFRRPPARRIGVRRGHRLGQRGLREPLALPHHGPGQVRGNARHPCSKGRALPQRGQRVERLQERILRDVLGLDRPAGEAIGQRIHARRVPVEQRREGLGLAALHPRHKPRVAGQRGARVVRRVRVRVRG